MSVPVPLVQPLSFFLTTHGRQDGKAAQRETGLPSSLYAVTAITRHPEGYLLH